MEILDILEDKQKIYSQGIMVEFIQPLFDLDYLSHDDYFDILNNHTQNTEKVELAIKQFRKDYSELQVNLHYSFYDFSDYKRYSNELNNVEIRFIHSLVSLDSEYEIAELPSIGSMNLHTRIINYRLNLYGVLPKSPNAPQPFSDETLASIQKIKTFINKEYTDLEIINKMGDISELEADLFENMKNPNLKFAYLPLREKPSLINADFEKSYKTGYSEFLIRLYQIHLWIRGFYQGKIDGEYKKISIEATENVIELINKSKNKKYGLSNFMQLKENDYFQLNVVDLLHTIPEIESNKFENIADVYFKVGDETNVVLEDIFSKNKDAEIIQEINNDAISNLTLGRRIYFGIKSIIKTAFETLKQFIGKIFNKVKSWMNAIKNIFSVFFREIREGLTILIHGLKFLFSKRIIETTNIDARSLIISDFDFDFDSFLAISDSIDEKMIKKHKEKCINLATSLSVSLLFTGIFTRIIIKIASGPVGWFRFLIEVIRVYSEIKQRKSRELTYFSR